MKVLFIVNPVSGRVIKNFPQYPQRYLDLTKHSYEIAYTRFAGDAEAFARDSNADIVVAVGGDGTVNEVGRALIGSEKIMGIIPCGSGNGLAYHLGLSNYRKAFDSINRVQFAKADAGLINGHLFFCTCGMGLDAEVSMLFSKSRRRGLLVYCIDTIKAWIKYSVQSYHITIDGSAHDVKALLVTVGNAKQWGNNALIAPLASVLDRQLDITVLYDLSIIEIPRFLIQLMTGRIYKNKKVSHYKGSEISICRDNAMPVHYDGDPAVMGSTLWISLSPEWINVLYNPGHNPLSMEECI